ncbi:MAG: hypothetical protein VX608_17740, partial [Chloroflexota bacterium]|nr:hypothetical protein [Chloroflexota bacterium]
MAEATSLPSIQADTMVPSDAEVPSQETVPPNTAGSDGCACAKTTAGMASSNAITASEARMLNFVTGSSFMLVRECRLIPQIGQLMQGMLLTTIYDALLRQNLQRFRDVGCNEFLS